MSNGHDPFDRIVGIDSYTKLFQDKNLIIRWIPARVHPP
jgi:hypothetical protein